MADAINPEVKAEPKLEAEMPPVSRRPKPLPRLAPGQRVVPPQGGSGTTQPRMRTQPVVAEQPERPELRRGMVVGRDRVEKGAVRLAFKPPNETACVWGKKLADTEGKPTFSMTTHPDLTPTEGCEFDSVGVTYKVESVSTRGTSTVMVCSQVEADNGD